jgi:hypothetical protein
MKNVNAALASVIVMAAITAPILARQSTGQQPLPAPEQQVPVHDERRPLEVDMKPVVAEKQQGRLVRVDIDRMTIVIEDTAEQEHEFRYTDTTKIVGAQEEVSGLSTRTGALVTVHFMPGAGDTRVATVVHIETARK